MKRGDGRGSASIEAILLIPAVVAMIGLMIAGGRIGITHTTVEGATRSAARAASMERSSSAATTAGVTVGKASLTTGGLNCDPAIITIDTSGYTIPTGQPATLTAYITCHISTADLLTPGLPGSYTIQKTVTVPLDTYRER